MTGGGVALLAIGSALGLVAAGQNDDAAALCEPFETGAGGTRAEHDACSTALDDARGTAGASTGVFVGGAALAAVGITLVVIEASGPAESAVRLRVRSTATGATATGALSW
jgi:hypothetical protein